MAIKALGGRAVVPAPGLLRQTGDNLRWPWQQAAMARMTLCYRGLTGVASAALLFCLVAFRICVLRVPTDLVQMRWKTSVPRTLTTRPSGPTYVAIHLVATVVGLTKRPDPTVVTLQSDVQFLDV